MIGLILKDLYSLRIYFLKQIALMAVLYLAISVAVIGSLAFFAPMIVMSVMMMLLSSFSFDETAKWDTYALTLPLSPRSIVGAKYLLSMGMLAVTSVLLLLVCGVVDVFTYRDGIGEIAVPTLCVGIVYLAMGFLVMPMFYKLGVEKARIAMILCVVAPMMLFVGAASFLEKAGFDFEALFAAVSVPMLAAGGVLLLAALGAGSYLLSVRFYAAREF